MSRINSSKFSKLLIAFFAVVLFVPLAVKTAKARPEYLKLFAADPSSRPELRSKCSTCHVNPAGAGERNEFGKAFAAAGFEITPALRDRFPNRFLSENEKQSDQPKVSFTEGSDSEAVVEINGKRYAINTKDKTVNELAPTTAPSGEKEKVVAENRQVDTREDRPNVYRQVDVRLINLPTAIPIPKGSLWTDFTHRFPFASRDAEELFGLDSLAIPSFGFLYGVTNQIHVGAFRSSTDVGRPILLYAGASLLDEHKGDPLSLMARVGLEGRDNFKRNFTTSFEFTFARSITRHAQLYVVPTVSVGDRPLTFAENNAPGATAVALGIGAAVNLRPSMALMAEANYRLNEDSRYIGAFTGIRRPVFGFGIQKASASRRHSFSLVFTNGPGTTIAQRSMTKGLLFGDDGFNGLTIGFNISRRLF
ncbi:MAG: DUF5777 family beta-barrel protein [Acidobacteria bacterium]|nr:DUF5777 family beta-barrel protein [Acidobacteriota bacterium]